jgi:hypothetical protein
MGAEREMEVGDEEITTSSQLACDLLHVRPFGTLQSACRSFYVPNHGNRVLGVDCTELLCQEV